MPEAALEQELRLDISVKFVATSQSRSVREMSDTVEHMLLLLPRAVNRQGKVKIRERDGQRVTNRFAKSVLWHITLGLEGGPCNKRQ